VATDVAREILIAGARALAHADDLEASLQPILAAVAAHLEVESAAVLMPNEQQHPRLEIVASMGLADATRAALTAAVANPDHPIARTFARPVSSFNAQPTAPGGPAWRSHLPLIVTRGQRNIVLGVLALAHDHAIDLDEQPLLQAVADLAAVAIDYHRSMTR
jgi:hypothetical protein